MPFIRLHAHADGGSFFSLRIKRRSACRKGPSFPFLPSSTVCRKKKCPRHAFSLQPPSLWSSLKHSLAPPSPVALSESGRPLAKSTVLDCLHNVSRCVVVLLLRGRLLSSSVALSLPLAEMTGAFCSLFSGGGREGTYRGVLPKLKGHPCTCLSSEWHSPSASSSSAECSLSRLPFFRSFPSCSSPCGLRFSLQFPVLPPSFSSSHFCLSSLSSFSSPSLSSASSSPVPGRSTRASPNFSFSSNSSCSPSSSTVYCSSRFLARETSFSRGLHTQSKGAAEKDSSAEKSRASTGKQTKAKAEEEEKKKPNQRPEELMTATRVSSSCSHLSSSSPPSSSSSSRGQSFQRGSGEKDGDFSISRTGRSASSEPDAQISGGAEETFGRAKDGRKQELARKKENSGGVGLALEEEEEASRSSDRSPVRTEEELLSRSSKGKKKKNRRPVAHRGEKTEDDGGFQSLENQEMSWSSNMDLDKDEEDPSSRASASSSTSSSSSSGAASSSSSSSPSHVNEESRVEGEGGSFALSVPGSALLSQRSPYSRFSCMRRSEEESLLKDALSKFKKVVKEQTELRGGKGWNVYEGWPPRSRIPLGNEQSKVSQLSIHPDR